MDDTTVKILLEITSDTLAVIAANVERHPERAIDGIHKLRENLTKITDRLNERSLA